MSRLPHIIWDMGGIIYRYFTEIMVDFAGGWGWPVEQLALGPTGHVPDPEYERLLIGEIDEPEYVRAVIGRLQSRGIAFDPVTDLEWTGRVRPETLSLITELEFVGQRQAILTNDASRWLGAGWWETWEHASAFDVMIDVATLDSRKPAAEPYLAVVEAMGVEPGECLFVDDLPVNVRGAEAVGMEGFLFAVTDPAGSVDLLRKRLDLPASGGGGSPSP